MIEALGMNTTVVATETGAAGVNKEVCGNKLKVVKDNDWGAFTNAVTGIASQSFEIPQTFYQQYAWESIVKKVVSDLS